MKAIHYGIIIGGVTIGIFFLVFIHINRLDRESMIQHNCHENLDVAVDSSLFDTKFKDKKADQADRSKVVINFFNTWFERMNISYDSKERERNKVFIPCLALIDNEGVSVYRLIQTNSGKYCETWTPKVMFTRREGDFVISVTQDNLMKICFNTGFPSYQCFQGSRTDILNQAMAGANPYNLFLNPSMYWKCYYLENQDFLKYEDDYQQKVEDVIVETLRKQFYDNMIKHSQLAKNGYGIGLDYKVPYISDEKWKIMARKCSVLAVFEGYTQENQLVYDYSFATR